MVKATEFPHLANHYEVMGVPRTVIDETIHVEYKILSRCLCRSSPSC